MNTHRLYGRAPWLQPEEMTDEQLRYYRHLLSSRRPQGQVVNDEGRLIGPFNARMLDPLVGTALQELSATLKYDTRSLSGRQREIVILETANHEGCSYEWTSHSRLGREAGVLESEIAAIADGTEAPTLNEAERVTLELARALLRHRDIPDALFNLAEGVVGLTVIFDVVSLVGHYQHTAMALKVWRVPDLR